MSRGGHNLVNGGTVETTRALNVMTLARAGLLSVPCSGVCEWRDKGEATDSIRIHGGKHAITLDYRYSNADGDWQDVEQRVPILWTPCRFGGERPWFICDVAMNGRHCGRKVAKLYGAGRLFACRHCYRLVYAIQRENRIVRPVSRLLRRANKLRRRLGCDPGMASLFPGKPKWMRRPTYERLRDQIWDAEMAADRIMDRFMEALLRESSRPL